MEIGRAHYLVSLAGRNGLAAVPPAYALLDPNQLASALRRDHAADAAAALGEQIVLREKARARLGEDTGFLFTADGLEMMTHPAVARRRAIRLAALNLPVADLTCGVGGDLAAVAMTGTACLGIDRDPATTLLAQANVPKARIVRGDSVRPPVRLEALAAIIDPSRRAAAGRRFDPAAFSPPWDAAVEILAGARAGVLKAPPGIDHSQLPLTCEVEFVQLGRSMREAAIWMGGGAKPGVRRAVLLPAGVELDSNAPQADPTPAEPGAVLFDPESCVTRATLVLHLAHRLGARLLDPQVAYLTSATPAFDPFCATFEVLDLIPFSVSRLKKLLRERHWKPDEIRRRAFPVEPDELRRLLGRIDGEPVTLVFTTLAGRRTVFVTRRLFPK